MTAKNFSPYLPALSVIITIIMAVMDGTIVNIALPTLTHEFNVSPEESIWIVNAYQMVIIMFLLIFARIGEIYGYKKVFLWGVIGFTFASALCSMAGNFQFLVIARLLQGIGAAGIMSVNTALVRFIFPPHLLAKGMSINAMAVAVSAAAGPTIAGIILSSFSWHWLFAINIPLGFITLWIGYRLLPNRREQNQAPIDQYSCLGNMLTFGLLVFALQSFAQQINYTLSVISFSALILIGYLYIRHELKRPIPLLPVDLMRIRIFRLSVITSVCSYMGQMLGMISLPFLLQDTLHYPPVEIGLLLTPWPLTTLIMAPIAAKLIEKFHPGIIGGIGMSLFSIGFITLYFMPEHAGRLDILWRIILCGAGFGLFQTPNNVTLVSSAPVNRSGGASGMLGMSRLVGQTVGTTMVAIIFSLQTHLVGTRTALLTAAIICALAIVSSFSRVGDNFKLTRKK